MVGDEPITLQTFNEYLLKRGAARAGLEQRETLLRELVGAESAAWKARAAGYEKRPEVQAELKRMVAARFKEEELGKLQPTEPTSAEIKAYYEANRARFSTPERVRCALIYLSVPAGAAPEKSAEARVRADALRAQALSQSARATGFGLLAQQYSEDQATRYQGGDLGYLTAKELELRLGPGVAKALVALDTPEKVSPPVSGPGGLYLLKCLAREPQTCRPLSEVRDGIAYLLRRSKAAETEKQFYADCAKGLDIRINHELIARVPEPDQAPRLPGVPETQTAFAK